MLQWVSLGDKMACSGDRKEPLWLGHTEMEERGGGRIDRQEEAAQGMALRPKEVGLKFILRERGAH